MTNLTFKLARAAYELVVGRFTHAAARVKILSDGTSEEVVVLLPSPKNYLL